MSIAFPSWIGIGSLGLACDAVKPVKICGVPGCGAKTAVKGLCDFHYRRKKAGKDLMAPRQQRLTESQAKAPKIRCQARDLICEVEGCGKPQRARGRCNPHYQKLIKGTSDLSPPIAKRSSKYDGAKCSVVGCARQAIKRELCGSHYSRWQKGKPLTTPFRPARTKYPKDAVCSVGGCSDRPVGLGMCKLHYSRSRNQFHGEMTAPRHQPRLGAGRDLTQQGYIRVSVPFDTPGSQRIGNGTARMLEHRYVMQQALGRPLLKCETPHHLNGNRTDNRLENLELWSSHQPQGQRVLDKVTFAVEMLTLYPQFIGLDLVDLIALNGLLDKINKMPRKSARRKPSGREIVQ